jgi:hypothetical protein
MVETSIILYQHSENLLVGTCCKDGSFYKVCIKYEYYMTVLLALTLRLKQLNSSSLMYIFVTLQAYG